METTPPNKFTSGVTAIARKRRSVATRENSASIKGTSGAGKCSRTSVDMIAWKDALSTGSAAALPCWKHRRAAHIRKLRLAVPRRDIDGGLRNVDAVRAEPEVPELLYAEPMGAAHVEDARARPHRSAVVARNHVRDEQH